MRETLGLLLCRLGIHKWYVLGEVYPESTFEHMTQCASKGCSGMFLMADTVLCKRCNVEKV